ncbi:MAG: type II toxin-antitoxin system VapC family toxin [Bacteroidota bacterium]|nr:type II toxin-antitoxin system VapC family toxin [Bacteroidota bacterium]
MGQKNYLIHTNVTIYYFGLALSKESEKFMDQILVDSYSISVLNRIELLGFKGLSGNESEALNSYISNSNIFDLEENIILETIQIRKKYNMKLPDAIIAATCLVNNCSLITNNLKDFDKITGLHLVKAEMRM